MYFHNLGKIFTPVQQNMQSQLNQESGYKLNNDSQVWRRERRSLKILKKNKYKPANAIVKMGIHTLPRFQGKHI